MKQIILASVFAAIVVYVWMFISWAFLPWHANLFKNLPIADSLASQVKSSVTERGIYRYPGVPTMTSKEVMNALAKKYAAGPVIPFMVYEPNGIDMVDPWEFAWGFIIDFLMALVAAVLLNFSTAKSKGFLARLGFVILIPVFAALIGPMIEWNWLLFPAGYSFGVALDYILTWLLAGSVLALVIRNKKAAVNQIAGN